MNNQVSRIESIAVTILYRYCKNCKIDFSSVDFCDLIVSVPESDFRFAVSVKRTTYTESEAYILTMDDILSYKNINEKYRIPYAIMCVNEAKETAKFGLIIDWYNSTPIINQKVSLTEITEKNWSKIYNQVLSLDKTIRALPNASWKVIKTIPIIDSNNNYWVEIMYLRDFNPNYKMSSPTVRSEKEKWNIFFKGIPQNEYPNDQLDDLILSKVREEFGNDSNVFSSLLLFNTELRDMQMKYKDYHRHTISLIIEPIWDEIFLSNYQGLNKQITIPLDAFVSPVYKSKGDALPNAFVENVELQNWMQDYFLYFQAKTTIHSLKEVIDMCPNTPT